jgi:poly(A) polymerase
MAPESSEPPQTLPRIIPRPEHTVSRRDIDVEALKVLYRLHHAGYIAYLVGGGVRDLLLGKTPKDFDVVTDARPGELRKLFRNSRIIGRRFRLVQVFFKGAHIVEVSTFRRRSEFDELPEAEGPTSRDNTFGTPSEDAQRRDLTINGLFYNIADFSLVDFVGGMEDLKAGRIRVIGDPAARFVRDPVRMLRVLRHAARTGFSIDAAAWEEIRTQGHLIRTCPAARVRDEILKDFRSGAAQPFFELMAASNLFYAIFPAWTGRPSVESRLLDLSGRLDLLVRDGVRLSDSLLWALFLTAYLEPELQPRDFKELREFIQEKIKEGLGGIEFPRQRQDEVSQMLALEPRLASLLKRRQPIPVRLTRLSLYSATWLLHQIKTAPEAELLERCRPEALPVPPPPAKRRRPRRRRRPRGRRRGKERAEAKGKSP